MKNLIIIFVSFFALQGAFAETAPTAPARDLKAIMKDMGPKFKVLGPQIVDPRKNPESAKLIQELGVLARESLTVRPPKIATLPAAEQRASELRYLRMILELNLQTVDAEEALAANNQAAAIEAVKQMGNLRGEGHDEFRE